MNISTIYHMFLLNNGRSRCLRFSKLCLKVSIFFQMATLIGLVFCFIPFNDYLHQFAGQNSKIHITDLSIFEVFRFMCYTLYNILSENIHSVKVCYTRKHQAISYAQRLDTFITWDSRVSISLFWLIKD